MTLPRTGIFELSVEVPPGATKTERDFTSFQLLNEMTWKINSLVEDGRGYELRARIVGKWEPGETRLAAERMRLDFSLVLLDPLAAEVGEWVKDLPVEVPEDEDFHVLPDVWAPAPLVFQKGRLGWQRIE